MTDPHWTQYLDPGCEDQGPQDLSAIWDDPDRPGVQQMVPHVGLPLLSRPALDGLLSADAWRGGRVGHAPEAALAELIGHGLITAKWNLTRKGAELTHKLQAHYYGH